MLGVLIRASAEDPSGEFKLQQPFYSHHDGIIRSTTSGLILDLARGWVVTTEAFLLPFLDKSSGSVSLRGGSTIDVLIADGEHEMSDWIPATVRRLFVPEGLSAAVEYVTGTTGDLAVGWPDYKIGKEHRGPALPMSFISRLVLLQLNRAGDALPDVGLRRASNNMLSIGSKVSVCGSPYGLFFPNMLFNATFPGIICAKYGPLRLTDARCFSGMEGGAVYDEQGAVVGMLLPPIRCLKGSPVELFPLVTIQNVLKALPELSAPALPVASAHADECRDFLAQLSRKVVHLHVGGFWGTGVIVSPDGLVVTNAHIAARGGLGKPIRARLTGAANWSEAVLIYATDADAALDVAVLQLQTPVASKLMFRSETETLPFVPLDPLVSSKIGDACHVIGYAVFEPGPYNLPTVSTGTVVHHAQLNGETVMLQISAPIHRGNSGGPVFSADGQLLGIATSHARMLGKSQAFLNFSIPVNQLRPVANFIASRNVGDLSPLNAVNADLTAMWNLTPTPPRPTDRVLNAALHRLKRQMDTDSTSAGAPQRGVKFAAFLDSVMPQLDGVTGTDGAAAPPIESQAQPQSRHQPSPPSSPSISPPWHHIRSRL